MLNLLEIADRIKQPEISSASDIESLKILCETYPYSQVFPLLYLKTLAQTNDVRLDSELQSYAYRIADRKMLFLLINNQIPVSVEDEQDVPPTVEKVEVEEIKVIEQLPELELEALSVDVPENELTSDEESVVEQFDIETEEVVEVSAVTETTEKDDLNELIITESSLYSLEKEEQKIAEREQLENAELEKEKQRLIDALINQKGLKKPEIEKIDAAEKRSFSSWLKTNAEYIESEEEKPILINLTEQSTQNKTSVSTAQDHLFKSRTDKKELFNPAKKAKESLDEFNLPVSETLAKIFASQGNYPKAIYAYQQLMLIFPEKKTFFASQIEELNKKII